MLTQNLLRLYNNLLGLVNINFDLNPFKRQPNKMVKLTKTIRLQIADQLFECLTIIIIIISVWPLLLFQLLIQFKEWQLISSNDKFNTSPEFFWKFNIYMFFLDCPKMRFQDFQKTHFFRYLLQILKFGPENFGQVGILS